MIESTWNMLLGILATMPSWLAAGFVGWSISIGLTQTLKFMIPFDAERGQSELFTRLIAFFVGFLASGVYYAEQPDSSPALLMLVMTGTGAWSPIAYALLIAGLRRFERLAWIADVLSQDKRGVIASKLRSRP